MRGEEHGPGHMYIHLSGLLFVLEDTVLPKYLDGSCWLREGNYLHRFIPDWPWAFEDGMENNSILFLYCW
jgi:hypothetical protein